MVFSFSILTSVYHVAILIKFYRRDVLEPGSQCEDTVLLVYEFPLLSYDGLTIFIMGIPIPGKMVFIFETGPTFHQNEIVVDYLVNWHDR